MRSIIFRIKIIKNVVWLAFRYDILLIIYYFFSEYIRMDHLRHQKYKNKRLENNLNTINID